MDALPRPHSGDGTRSYSDDSIRASYGVIVKICLGSGLSPIDADDLAQDLWEWLIRTGVSPALIATPWLKAAVRNYILRFRRRSYWRSAREGRSLETIAGPQSQTSLPILESNRLLDQLSASLPETERRMLSLIRRGYSIADAARILKIPAGSRDFHKSRIVAYARRELQRRGRLPITRA
jgi:DNA-directed RNA polymerase specialized sigma24 family protein